MCLSSAQVSIAFMRRTSEACHSLQQKHMKISVSGPCVDNKSLPLHSKVRVERLYDRARNIDEPGATFSLVPQSSGIQHQVSSISIVHQTSQRERASLACVAANE